MNTNHKMPFLQLEKPCKIVYPCCCRPELIVRHVGMNAQGVTEQRRFGRIVLPCQMFSPTLDVYWNQSGQPSQEDGSDESLVYTITADCCQCGLFLPQWPCSQCQTVNFEIRVPGQE